MKFGKYLAERQRNNLLRNNEIRKKKVFLRLFDHLYKIFVYGKQRLITLNLYLTIPLTINRKILRRNRRSTRIYLILLFTAFSFLIVYTLLKQETNIVIIESPSLVKYRQLLTQNSLTLQCPCRNIAIKYSKFITQIQPEYHEVCSSIFISLRWIESISKSYFFAGTTIEFGIITNELTKQFRTLSTLCQISEKMLNTSLSIFHQSDFLSAYVISEHEFSTRIELLIEQFKSKVFSQFTETFQLIQLINHANEFATVYFTNWLFVPKYQDVFQPFKDIPIHALTEPRIYSTENKCSCGIQSNCSKLSDSKFSA
ncbi:hypothetical protein I4U23_015974 [Adineta vaga]|nr:hypothetical protein I4U23_015974 [Adineta vaga]